MLWVWRGSTADDQPDQLSSDSANERPLNVDKVGNDGTSCEGRGDRRRRHRLRDPLSPGQDGLARCGAPRTQGTDGGLLLACRRQPVRADQPFERCRLAKIHDRALSPAGGRERSVLRLPSGRRHSSGQDRRPGHGTAAASQPRQEKRRRIRVHLRGRGTPHGADPQGGRTKAVLHEPIKGYCDPASVTQAYAKAARDLGAKVYRQTPVVATTALANGGWDVVTPQGTIRTDYVVNAAGLWAREVAALAGIDLPLMPVEHHYMVTETIPRNRRARPRDPQYLGTERGVLLPAGREGAAARCL